MKTLEAMTRAELEALKTAVEGAITIVSRRGLSFWELANFRNAIDNELDRRGA